MGDEELLEVGQEENQSDVAGKEMFIPYMETKGSVSFSGK